MKKIILHLTGRGVGFQFAKPINNDEDQYNSYWSMLELEEDGLIEDYFEFGFIETIDELYWYVEGCDTVKNYINKKGKYIKVDDFILKTIQPPFIVQYQGCHDLEMTFDIVLEDEEEFDSMKLQLIKSNYEVEFLPYGIVPTKIVYNNKEVEANEELFFDEEDECWLYKGFGTGCNRQY